jgi:hypothetical protein
VVQQTFLEYLVEIFKANVQKPTVENGGRLFLPAPVPSFVKACIAGAVL